MNFLHRILQFVDNDIWRIPAKDLPWPKSFLLRQLRVIVLAVRGTVEDRCQLRASSLTFYSLLSIVPVFAMIFGIAKGFGFDRAIEQMIYEKLEGQEEVATRIVGFAQALLQNAEGGIIASVGVGILFLIIILILSDIENAFNDIWGIRSPRRLGRKVSDYLSLMLICPVLFITSSALTVVIASGIKEVVQKIDLLGAVSPAIFFVVNLLPYCVLWILFTYLYLFMPNTKINFRSGAVAGIIAAAIYTIFQWGYINFQILVARYNAIYGSFAALPLFFVWLHASWLIMLFGAEISFASQNVDDFEFEKDCRSVSHAFKRLLSLSIAHLLVKHFSNGGGGWTAIQISKKLEIPLRLVNRILYDLVSSGVVSEIKVGEGRMVAFQPAKDPETMTIKYVIDALEQKGSSSLKMAESEELQRLMKRLEVFNDLVEKSEANLRIKEI